MAGRQGQWQAAGRGRQAGGRAGRHTGKQAAEQAAKHRYFVHRRAALAAKFRDNLVASIRVKWDETEQLVATVSRAAQAVQEQAQDIFLYNLQNIFM